MTATATYLRRREPDRVVVPGAVPFHPRRYRLPLTRGAELHDPVLHPSGATATLRTTRREAFTASVAATLVAHQVDLVAMAGFGTVLSEAVHKAFPDRILNTHPALLPAFPGWHGVRDALAAGVSETGCTVHLATLEMDAGPILAQEAVPVLDGDTEATLHERIKVV